MLTIRLQGTGKRNDRTFRIVLAEKSAPVKGKVQEILGHYLPTRTPKVFECDMERVSFWVGRGAQVSSTLARLFKRQGAKGMDRFIQTYTKKKSKNEEEAPAPAATPAAAAPAPEAPKEQPAA
ncbi:TPA: 30S ribosomal protein S16 [Candidatus Peribacteria bacterium]|jgi:small subunit ribosomal protein S16|nr:MAG: 30S ribosomal protein S16 [Candidatus Peribacteria bacterium RIFOXYC2_FULL_58_10]OGJ83784.1 MAG: 30S ribosomal protein S16 [Candidatus Peribacteria bacterium RIFOXYD2_FULL_58_15]HAI98515.1 30S ribosomal protein S16 [Candidatus Peribacteria bacterium]HAS34227.1 30S ribosomal protein S16 [Candidatus Peribacteria bacterium]